MKIPAKLNVDEVTDMLQHHTLAEIIDYYSIDLATLVNFCKKNNINFAEIQYVPSWSEFDGWNSWGFDNAPAPDIASLFPSRDPKYTLVDNSDLEDFLQHNEVFKNGIKGNSCHMDSYMTVVDFKALQRALNILIETYSPTKEQWQQKVDSWLKGCNTQPPAKIVAHYIQNTIIK